MFLEKLNVLNFKNHSDSQLILDANINCFVGNNGSGKTNLLDAIHYLSLTKSFFVKQDAFNIKHHQPYMSIEGVFNKNNATEVIQCAIKTGAKKVFRRNKKTYQKLSDHIGLFPLVMVSPTDTELLLGGSDLRRKYMDSVISQFDSNYLEALMNYNQLLAQRNAILKSSQRSASNLEIYDEQLMPLAQIIFDKRKLFLDDLSTVFLKYYQAISGTNESVDIAYHSQLFEGNFIQLAQKNFQKDITLQFTSCGIHKDDLIFNIDNYLIKKIGSQGQQKTYLLALKLAQFDFMKDTLGFKPMLLLDDIFDKLDDNRVEHLMTLVHHQHFGQIFVTDTHPQRSKHIFNKIDAKFKVFLIKNGNVEKE